MRACVYASMHVYMCIYVCIIMLRVRHWLVCYPHTLRCARTQYCGRRHYVPIFLSLWRK